MLVHDRAVLDDPALVEAVAATTRIAVGNVRLQAEVQARVEQLAASRRRIVEAADAQRRRLERELHDGAEQRLAAVSAHVEALAHDLDEPRALALLADVETQLDAARAELSELARGIHPSALTTGGLAAALAELASRAPVPVEVSVDAGRFPRPSRRPRTSYAPRRSPMSRNTRARRSCGSSCAATQADWSSQIVDDGVGGADPAAGRACAVSLIASRRSAGGSASTALPGAGTRVVAEIPASERAPAGSRRAALGIIALRIRARCRFAATAWRRMGGGETLPGDGPECELVAVPAPAEVPHLAGPSPRVAAGTAREGQRDRVAGDGVCPRGGVARRLLLRDPPAVEDHLRAAVVFGVDLALEAPAARRSSGVVWTTVDAVDRRGLAVRAAREPVLEHAGASGVEPLGTRMAWICSIAALVCASRSSWS